MLKEKIGNDKLSIFSFAQLHFICAKTHSFIKMYLYNLYIYFTIFTTYATLLVGDNL